MENVVKFLNRKIRLLNNKVHRKTEKMKSMSWPDPRLEECSDYIQKTILFIDQLEYAVAILEREILADKAKLAHNILNDNTDTNEEVVESNKSAVENTI